MKDGVAHSAFWMDRLVYPILSVPALAADPQGL